jgi:hypothetical protein
MQRLRFEIESTCGVLLDVRIMNASPTSTVAPTEIWVACTSSFSYVLDNLFADTIQSSSSVIMPSQCLSSTAYRRDIFAHALRCDCIAARGGLYKRRCTLEPDEMSVSATRLARPVHVTAVVIMFRACWAQRGRCNRFPSTALGERGEAMCSLLSELRCARAVHSVKRIGFRPANGSWSVIKCTFGASKISMHGKM